MISRDDCQIAVWLGVSKETMKAHVCKALVKFNFHGKSELRMRLGRWDFSKWSQEAQD
jgi:DNA-binding NarL/FixJ family response regulator